VAPGARLGEVLVAEEDQVAVALAQLLQLGQDAPALPVQPGAVLAPERGLVQPLPNRPNGYVAGQSTSSALIHFGAPRLVRTGTLSSTRQAR
jgi:hypothetical protein